VEDATADWEVAEVEDEDEDKVVELTSCMSSTFACTFAFFSVEAEIDTAELDSDDALSDELGAVDVTVDAAAEAGLLDTAVAMAVAVRVDAVDGDEAEDEVTEAGADGTGVRVACTRGRFGLTTDATAAAAAEEEEDDTDDDDSSVVCTDKVDEPAAAVADDDDEEEDDSRGALICARGVAVACADMGESSC
jgi:hypothetical protein